MSEDRWAAEDGLMGEQYGGWIAMNTSSSVTFLVGQ
jgi:hypothetical protein